MLVEARRRLVAVLAARQDRLEWAAVGEATGVVIAAASAEMWHDYARATRAELVRAGTLPAPRRPLSIPADWCPLPD